MTEDDADPEAEYVFRVRIRLDPTTDDLRIEPTTVEATLYKRAAPPGEEGWLFFRDNLWRGDLSAPAHFRDLTEDAIDAEVESVSFSELRTSPAYRDALEAEIEDNLGTFKSDTVSETLNKYFGSSIRVTE